ncbi:hypothetical protein HWV62_1424 [Athelia sp. TMB]|nr:hypothetical protein HWV62_1424 [Athelia sp. TMB]
MPPSIPTFRTYFLLRSIFVPPENNAILEFLLGRTVTGESPSKANARRESLRPRAGSSPVRDTGKGKERRVDSEDEDAADAAATAPSKQTRRKSVRLRSESVQPIAGSSRDVGEAGSRSSEAKKVKDGTRGEDETFLFPIRVLTHSVAALKPKPQSRSTKAKGKAKQNPESDDGLDEPEPAKPPVKLKPKPKSRSAKTKAAQLEEPTTAGEAEPEHIEVGKPAHVEPSDKPKAKPKPPANKANAKKLVEPATAEEEPDPEEPKAIEVKPRQSKSKSKKTSRVIEDDEPVTEAVVEKPAAKQRGRTRTKETATAIVDTEGSFKDYSMQQCISRCALPDDPSAATEPVPPEPVPLKATRQSLRKRAREVDEDESGLSDYLPAARKRPKIATTTAPTKPKAAAKPTRTTVPKAKTKAVAEPPDSPKAAPTRKAPVRKKQAVAVVDPYESDGSAIVLVVKKKPGKAATAGLSRQDPPPERPPSPKAARRKAVAKGSKSAEEDEDPIDESDADTPTVAKGLKNGSKSAKSRSKAAPVEPPESDAGERDAAKTSKPPKTKVSTKSSRIASSTELVAEGEAEDSAWTLQPKASKAVVHSRSDEPVVDEEPVGKAVKAENQQNAKPKAKPKQTKRPTKALVDESEDEQEPSQRPPKPAKKAPGKTAAKRSREHDSEDEAPVFASKKPAQPRKRAKTVKVTATQSDPDEKTPVPPEDSRGGRAANSKRNSQRESTAAKQPQKPAAKSKPIDTRGLPPEKQGHIKAKPLANRAQQESDDDPIDFLS